MSSTGVRRIRSTELRLAGAILDEDREQIESEKIFKDAGQNASAPGIANLVTPGGNFLSKAGDIRRGPMGNEFSIVGIIDNSIDVSITTPNYTPFVIVTPEGGADDILDNITPGSSPFFNQEIILQGGNVSFSVTLQENLANDAPILTPGGVDVVLDLGDTAGLIYSQLVSAWIVLWVSSGSGGGTTSPLTTKGDIFGFSTVNDRIPVGTDGQILTADSADALGVSWQSSSAFQFPIRPPITDLGTIGSITQILDLETTDGHVFKAIINGDVDFTFDNYPPSGNQQEWEVEIIQDGTGGHIVEFVDSEVVNPPTIPTTPNSTTIVVFRTNDGGTSVRVGNTVNTTAGATFLSQITIDVTKDWGGFGITNLGDITMNGDIDLNTFDMFDIDQIAFQSSTGTLSSLNVGFATLGSGSFRGNILDAGRFEWTEENVELMRLSEASSLTSLNVTGIIAAEINLGETTGGVTGTFLQGSTTFQYTTTGTQHEFLIGVESIVTIDASGIEMQGTNFILTPQVGFSNLGNLIEDDANGLIFTCIPTDDFTWDDGTNTFAILDIDGLFLNDMFIQIDSITAPTTTGLDIGKIFMDSGNSNHLSVVRDTTVIDLEAGSIPLTTKGDLLGFDTGTARIPVGTDGQVLTANSAVALGVEWATAASGSQTPWLSNIDADGFSLNNLLSLDIEDSAGATKLSVSGPLGVGARFSFVSGDTVFFTENITDILSIDSGGLNILPGTGSITFNNGFNIENTDTTTTTFEIPEADTLIIQEGLSDARLTIEKNVIIDVDTSDDFIVNENGIQVGKYDGGTDDWVLNPGNDVQLSPGNDIDLTPTDDIIMNPGGEINVFEDLDMQGTNTIDMGTSASSGSTIPSVADGYFQIKENGVTRFVPFFDTLP